MGVTWSQIFPPPPSFTEKDLPSLKDRVFIVTGGASGVGRELSIMLYRAGGRVYIAGRSQQNAEEAISHITSLAGTDANAPSSSSGTLHFLHLDLQDLTSIKPAAEDFKRRESRLDILFNNAGISLPPQGSVSAQGHELMMATNCLGPFLFTQLLLPLLRDTAQTMSSSSPAQPCPRVVWTSSQVVDLSAPAGGISLEDVVSPGKDQSKNYTTSKTGNWFLASEMARDPAAAGIVSVTQNPGGLKTNLLRHTSRVFRLLVSPLLHDAKMGAYTELWAGLSPEVTLQRNGSYIIPWGRFHPGPRRDLVDALKGKEEGGTGQARDFLMWCEQQVADYR